MSLSNNKNLNTVDNPHCLKRKFNSSAERNVQFSESVLNWPNTEESFFSNNSSFDSLLTNSQLNPASITMQSNSFHNKDDSLFSDIIIPAEAASKKYSHEVHKNENEFNDSLFGEINMEAIPNKEIEEDLFADNFDIDMQQNTQKFLEDVAFKVPQLPPKRMKIDASQKLLSQNNNNNSLLNSSYVSKSILDDIRDFQGTQFITHEEIQQQREIDTKVNISNNNPNEINELCNFSWTSQAFEDVIAEPEFASKGEFYGLPDKVKQLIFEHKGIKSLYGKNYKYLKF